LLSGLVENEPALLAQAPFIHMKVEVGDFVLLDNAGRAEHVVTLLDDRTAGPLRQGINRFEELLKHFNLSGPVSGDMSKTLFELQQVRNLHAHRQGIADVRFSKACPWLNATIGNYHAVTRMAVDGYFRATVEYVLELIYRTNGRYGWNREQLEAHMKRVQLAKVVASRSSVDTTNPEGESQVAPSSE
jgi:hypothetical protein